MGCDIHIFVETRLSPKEPWKLDPRHEKDGELNETSVGNRWYSLFNELAGVRGMGGIFEPRGLPDDCDPRIKDMVDHTPTWLTLDEFKCALLKAYKEYDDEAYDSITRRDPFFDFNDIPYTEHPKYDDLVNHFDIWRFSKLLDNHMHGTKHRPEVRIIFFFDS